MIYGRIDLFACGYQVKNYKHKERVGKWLKLE